MLTRTVILVESPHQGDHLAWVSINDAEGLGVAQEILTKFVFVVVTNTVEDKRAYARLYISAEIPVGAVGLQEHIARNCQVRAGGQVLIQVWEPLSVAQVAKTISVQLQDSHALTLLDEVEDLRQRLEDSKLTLEVGHTVSYVILNKVLWLSVSATEPADTPVICGEETRLIVEGLQFKSTSDSNTKATFTEIGGLEQAIGRIRELVILPLLHPQIFTKLGIQPSKGIILHGPPGSGKTLLARTVAKNINATFFSINGPEILSKFYGDSEMRLREVFAKAHNAAPSIVFIDELDSIVPSRENVSGDLEIRIVSQLLVLMDGLVEREGVVVIGATNRLHAIDPALRRPGRFDCEIEILPPNTNERKEILEVHSRSMQLAEDVVLQDIARRTVGFVGADLAALCQEAALSVVRRIFGSKLGGDISWDDSSLVVTAEDFRDALRLVQPSAFRVLDQPDASSSWEELIGLESVKKDLAELIEWPLTHREEIQHFGVEVNQSVLLVGPPLSGKTTLITALARHLNISLIYIRAEDLVGQWRRESEQVIRKIFRRARLTEPSLVFVDHLEQLFLLTVSESDLPAQILGLIQYEMDQLRYSSLVFLIAAIRDTSESAASLEKSSLFTDVVHIEIPDKEDIKKAINFKLGAYLADEIDLDSLSQSLNDLSLSTGQVFQVCERAARTVLRENLNAQKIHLRHFQAGIQGIVKKFQ
jgi:transitional endoplasmic reticulum ATPase